MTWLKESLDLFVLLVGAFVVTGVALVVVLRYRRRHMIIDPCSADAARMSPVVCFADDSETDSRQNTHGIIGGLVMNWREVPEFNDRWLAMLERHGVPGALHMREFGRHGKLRRIRRQRKLSLLTEAVELIKHLRIHSYGSQVNNRDFRCRMPPELLEHISVYGLGFMMSVVVAHKTADNQHYRGTIDYVFDRGNSREEQVKGLHRAITESESMRIFQVGSLTHCSDENVPALQAADVIAWATRRRYAGERLDRELEPLNSIFDDRHADSPLTDEALQQLVDSYTILLRTSKPAQ